MEIQITDKLVSVIDNTVLGFLVSAGGTYKVAVTKSFAQENEIVDADLGEYYDVPELSVVPIRNNQYGLVSNSVGYIADFCDTPVGILSDMTAFYGYMFRDQHIVTLDSISAFERMIRDVESRGVLEV